MNLCSTLLCVLVLVPVLTSCGGGGSAGGSGPPPSQVTSVTVTPGTAQVPTGQGLLFDVQVAGTGSFSSSVTWSVNGVAGGNSTFGTIANGQYMGPGTPPSPANVTITATSVQDSSKSGNSTATIIPAAVLNSFTPSSASAGDLLTVDVTFNGTIIETPLVVFSGVNGTSVAMTLNVADNPLTVRVPFGATSGPVYMTIPPQPGSGAPTVTSNSISFTRLPNLLVHASSKDLSSGETLQLDWRVLGANSPNTVTWTADSGSISSKGVFQAPVVSSESYSHVTGCIQNTTACNPVLLRILPFRITPASPIVNVGETLQLSAIQGSSTLAPQWSLLSGGGSISTSGLFTAPTVAAQAGAVQISATVGSTTEQTSIAVAGGFAGQVNRVYDYANFNVNQTPGPAEATFVKSVAVSGNRAYALTLGDPYGFAQAYVAMDVYDITNPDQPVWIDAGEAPWIDVDFAGGSFADVYSYGNNLLSIDDSHVVSYSLSSQVPSVTSIIPIGQPMDWTMNNGVLYVLSVLDLNIIRTTWPIDLYDVSTGTLVHKHYELPYPPSSTFGGPSGISGNGNIVYLSGSTEINNTPTFTIATYDISQSPPAVLSTIETTSSTEYGLQVVGNLLFADSQVYDISNVTPVYVTTLPLPLRDEWGVQGTKVLATSSFNTELIQYQSAFSVVDISSPSQPVIDSSVPDLLQWNLSNPITGVWASNGRFYSADGTGGFGVYNVSVKGGPTNATPPGFELLRFTAAQVLQGQTLYAAGVFGSQADLICLDVSGGTPNLLGSLFYANDSGTALQVSGTTAYFGLTDLLKVVDVSNPQSPAEVGSVTIPVDALALSGNTLFVGTGDGRLVVFNVSTRSSPTQLASLSMPAASTMHVSGKLLFVAAGQNGMLVFDVSQPSAPALLSQFAPTPSAPVWDVLPLTGSEVMLAADSSGLVTVDLSNPASPKQTYQQQLPFLNAFPAPGTSAYVLPAFVLSSQNNLVYLGTTAGVMLTFDATVPSSPRLMALDAVTTPYNAYFVSVITPGTDNLYLSVPTGTVQLDNTIPQNVIEMYYPPAALSNAVPSNANDSVRAITKAGRMASKSLVNGTEVLRRREIHSKSETKEAQGP